MKWAVITLLALVIVVSGCTVITDPCASFNSSDTYERDKKDICYNYLITATKDLSHCKKITIIRPGPGGYFYDSTVASCPYRYGKEFMDPGVCEKIENSEREDSKDYCYLGIVEARKNQEDANLCSLIEVDDTRDRCYSNLAKSLKDETLCSMTIYPDNCYLGVGLSRNDSSLCSKITDGPGTGYKNSCYYNIFISTKNSSICNKINDSSLNSYCRAVTENNPAYCNEVEEFRVHVDYPKTNSTCIYDIAISSGNSSLCEFVPYEDQWHCYRNVATTTIIDVAVARQDPSICETTNDSWLKKSCYYGVAVARQDPSICERISSIDLFYQSDCYSELSLYLNNPGLCDKIDNQYSKDDCYLEFVRIKKMADESICDKISNSDERDECYIELIILDKDSAICNKITDKMYANLCRYIAQNII